MAAIGVLPVSLFYTMSQPSLCASVSFSHISFSLFEATSMSQCQTSFSPQLPTPFL